MKRYLSNRQIWLLFFFLLGCRQSSMDKADGPAVIDVLQQIGNYRKVSVSEFISELEYIPLETSDNCVIGVISREDVIITKSHIFVKDENGCYAFSRSGKFITQIGRFGQGPGEYTHISIVGIFVDEEKQSLYNRNSAFCYFGIYMGWRFLPIYQPSRKYARTPS